MGFSALASGACDCEDSDLPMVLAEVVVLLMSYRPFDAHPHAEGAGLGKSLPLVAARNKGLMGRGFCNSRCLSIHPSKEPRARRVVVPSPP